MQKAVLNIFLIQKLFKKFVFFFLLCFLFSCNSDKKTGTHGISTSKDPDYIRLCENFPPATIEALAEKVVHSAIQILRENNKDNLNRDKNWYIEVPESILSPSAETGIAVRFILGGIDRGCLSIWRNVKDIEAAAIWCTERALSDPRYPPIQWEELENLDLEISLFSPWHAMDGPRDFRPGQDSLILEEPCGVTLLQASLAEGYQFNDLLFLKKISKKAGLGPNGWKDPSIKFFRSATKTYRRPFTYPKKM